MQKRHHTPLVHHREAFQLVNNKIQLGVMLVISYVSSITVE